MVQFAMLKTKLSQLGLTFEAVSNVDGARVNDALKKRLTLGNWSGLPGLPRKQQNSSVSERVGVGRKVTKGTELQSPGMSNHSETCSHNRCCKTPTTRCLLHVCPPLGPQMRFG
uniref:Uncharacterized protein n=1 Tax=Eutreptiella gymnastica TaxID=73025 RepID=A0A7S1I793_9EUGL|mmetsp:Transcript_135878/g.235695  ORF Transcript_135878/g.235695 Transcript_135878/m.235695 type:complete len:114 (+) Transcript_135878:156-497(+)